MASITQLIMMTTPNQVYMVSSTVHFDDKASDDKAMNVTFTKKTVFIHFSIHEKLYTTIYYCTKEYWFVNMKMTYGVAFGVHLA